MSEFFVPVGREKPSHVEFSRLLYFGLVSEVSALGKVRHAVRADGPDTRPVCQYDALIPYSRRFLEIGFARREPQQARKEVTDQ